MATQKAYKVRLHIISPTHIGCDDVYEPTGFSIDKGAKKLIAFDPIDFVRSLNPTERQKFMALCDKGNLESILEIYKFMWNLPNVPQGHEVEVSDGFIETYERISRMNVRDLKKGMANNNFLAHRTSYLPTDNMPYIPGSAIKGALRTAWINHLNKRKAHQIDDRNRNAGKDLEKILLAFQKFEADPMTMLKISDFMPVGQAPTKICFAVNRKPGRTGGPDQMIEIICHDRRVVFEGMITIRQPEQDSPIHQMLPTGIEFFQDMGNFFALEMQEEGDMFQRLKLPDNSHGTMKKQFPDELMKTVFPIRIGRHSGAQCMTIAGARRIKIKNGRPPIQSKATSLWLAGDSNKATSGLLPFGWCALEVSEADPQQLWSERVKIEQVKPIVVKTEPPKPAIITEIFVWENAVLLWTPGNATLTASLDSKKAEFKLTGDRSIVPAELHKKLFDKKAAVTANITVEKEGNIWRILKIG